MSTHLSGFLSFSAFFILFCIDQISHQQHKGYIKSEESANLICGSLLEPTKEVLSFYLLFNLSFCLHQLVSACLQDYRYHWFLSDTQFCITFSDNYVSIVLSLSGFDLNPLVHKSSSKDFRLDL